MSGKKSKASKVVSYQEFSRITSCGKIYPVYLFCGEERKLLHDALNLLKSKVLSSTSGSLNFEKVSNKEVHWQEILTNAAVLPLFATHRMLVVEDFFMLELGKREETGQDAAELLTYLENPCPSTCLVLITGPKVDTRKKIYKKILNRGLIVYMRPFQHRAALSWIKSEFNRKGKEVTNDVPPYLLTAVGNNLSILNLEIEKLVSYVGHEQVVNKEMAQKVVAGIAEPQVFDLVDAVGIKNTIKAICELRSLLNRGEPPIFILYMLARQFRLLMKTKVLLSKKLTFSEIASQLHIPPFVARKVIQQTNYYNFENIEFVFKQLLKMDQEIKSNVTDKLTVLELGIIKLCK